MQLQIGAAAIGAALVMVPGTMAKGRPAVKPEDLRMANMKLKRCRISQNSASFEACCRNPTSLYVKLRPRQLVDGLMDLLHAEHDARGA
jgi:hypothetical protein